MADLKKFLDQQGVSILWSKVAEKIAAEATARDKAIEDAIKSEATARGLAIEDLRSYVGEIPEGYVDQKSIIAYINKKAEETLAAANGGSSESAASVKAALDAEILRAKAAEEVNATAAKAADDKAVAAQSDVDALERVVGEVAEGKTVVQMIAEAKAEATYDDTVLAGRVSTLEGSDAGKSVREIANAELAAQLVAEDAKESLDTLAEIAAWIQNHPDDASAMNEAIVALQNQMKGIGAGEGTVKKYVDDAISALSIGDYAKAADLTALAGRVKAVEDDYLKAADKTELSGAISGVSGRVKAVEDDYLKAADKTELSNAIGLKASQADLEVEVTARQNAVKANAAEIAKKANLTYVDEELAKKQNVIPENTYDAYGSAASALSSAKSYVDAEVAKKQDIIPENTYDAHGAAASALASAKSYTDAEVGKIKALSAADIEAAIAAAQA